MCGGNNVVCDSCSEGKEEEEEKEKEEEEEEEVKMEKLMNR